MAGELPLQGRVALVTGVSRPIGIAHTVAARLEALGAAVVRSGWPPHDLETPWGRRDDAGDVDAEHCDLADPAAPAQLLDTVLARHGAIDIVVAVHARSSSQTLATMSVDELDRSWAVNVRSILLLAQGFLARHDHERPGGRLLWFTSGQHLQPMPAEVPYAVTKGALHQMTATIAAALTDSGIATNCINPGPVDTGWASGSQREEIARMFPSGRWGTPDDVANLVAFLVSDAGGWIQGQVIDSEGGFRRFGPIS
jgi:3-oxoacyl-[acyl-carrier protein] reductase